MNAPAPAAPDPGIDVRVRALELLDAFRDRVMPSFVRRLRSWTGLDPRLHTDVIDDVFQELALDCVANAETVIALSAESRHRRWLRLAQQQHYELRVRPGRRGRSAELVELTGTPPPSVVDLGLEPADEKLLARIAQHAERLGNGRFCARATARAARIGNARLRQVWADVTDALGLDHEHLEFWRRRLAEALCMIAAARLRESGAVRLWDDAARRPFDADAFRRRIERIRDALIARPIDPEIRQTLVKVAPRRPGDLLGPRELLDLAEGIAAGEPLVLMWRFEAELSDGGDLREAAHCLWQVRAREKDRVRVVLARARLLEARGRLDAARRLLARAIGRRDPVDPRLVASLRATGGAPTRRSPSARQIARPDEHGVATAS